MLDIKIDTSMISDMARRIDGVADQMPFLLAYALTKSVQAAQQGEREVMERVFDRPTRYTLNALAVIPATKYALKATLHFREFGGTPAWKYLGPEIRGGPRGKKGFERALEAAGILQGNEYVVPGRGMPLDGYGNIPGGQITRILSALGANRDQPSNTTARSRRKGGRNLNYFVLRNGQVWRSHDATRLGDRVKTKKGKNASLNGVYLRTGDKAIPMLIFVKQPSYTARFPYYETAEAIIKRSLVPNFHEGFRRYVVPKFKRAA